MSSQSNLQAQRLIEFYSDASRPLPPRRKWGPEALGIRSTSLWKLFSPKELNRIQEAIVEHRRRGLGRILAKVDEALIKQAIGGDVAAIRLVYEKFEGWRPGQQVELTGQNGGAMEYRNLSEEELLENLQVTLARVDLAVVEASQLIECRAKGASS